MPEPVEYQPRCRGQVVYEPPQASNRRSLVRAKTPRKTRGVLISIDSLCLLGRGGVARQNTSAGRRIACLRTRRGGVNDPAGLPAWPPVRLHRCRWLGGPRGSANGKKHPPGGEGLSHSPADGGNHPSKATCLSSVVNSWRKGPFSPTGYVRQSEDRLCEPQSPRLDHQRCWITQLRPSWQRPVRPGSAIARAWWTSAWCWCCGTAPLGGRSPRLVRHRALRRRQRPSARRAEPDRSDWRRRSGPHHLPGHGRLGPDPAAHGKASPAVFGMTAKTIKLPGHGGGFGRAILQPLQLSYDDVRLARAAVLQRCARRGEAFSHSLELDSALARSTQHCHTIAGRRYSQGCRNLPGIICWCITSSHGLQRPH